MNTLVQEGAKYNIKVNALAPTAGTRMTEGLIPEAGFRTADPGNRDPAVLYLVSLKTPPTAPLLRRRRCLPVAKIVETDGAWLAPEEQTPEGIAANWDADFQQSRG